MYIPVMQRSFNQYQKLRLETQVAAASSHDLIQLLYEGCLESLNQALGAMERGEQLGHVKPLTKASRLIDEGLRAGLDMKAGGEVAHNLNALYDYLLVLIGRAHARRDPELVKESIGLLVPVADAWRSIKYNHTGAPLAQGLEIKA
jgi:flagellar secretion chaperone FliS